MTNSTTDLDAVDRDLLGMLVADARATHHALGKDIGRSPSAIARRQRILEDVGIIAGYQARLDARKLGFSTVIHLKISLDNQRRETMEAFEAAISKSPSVARCDLMSGTDDYIVTILARSLDHFAAIHREELSQLPGVAGMESAFVLREIVAPRVPPAMFER